MTSEIDSASSQANSGVAAQAYTKPGTLLREARERSGVSLDEISDATRITLPRLEALEKNDYSRAGASATFIVGYIRAYARYLGIQPNSFIQAFERDYVESPTGKEEILNANFKPSRKQGKYSNIMPIALGLILFIAAMLVVKTLFFADEPTQVNQTGTPGDTKTPASDSFKSEEDIDNHKIVNGHIEEGVVLEDPNINGTDAMEVKIETDSASPSAPLAQLYSQARDEKPEEGESSLLGEAVLVSDEPQQGPASQELASAATATESESLATELPGPAEDDQLGLDSLMMNFSDECWVQVKNATGETLVAKIAEAGETLSFNDIAPYNIMLGNAEAAVVQINGRFIDTQPKIGKRTLRITVGP